MEGGSNSSKSGVVVVTNERRPSGGIRIQNPFTLKVGQVFTGFGIGCGVGIGVGRPINLGAIPVLNQVMGATRGATDALSGASRHVNNALRKVGAKNIEAGIGCGVGIGHGFGVGLALKPGVLQQIQFHFVQGMTKIMTKFGISPNLAIGQGTLPSSLQSAIGNVNDQSQNSMGSSMPLSTKPPDHTSQSLPGYGNNGTGSPVDTPFGSRTEKVLSSFLQSPLLKGEEDSEPNEGAGRLRSENKILQMILKHQQIIEELMEENDKLRHILVEDLKVSPSKLQASYSSKNRSPCTDCFECRRKQRRK
ncbi:uncharacterized protein LOC126626668 [Malus sylvestris]|uniref:uncharacterized protein LOC126626668 n=1 Tax=Malus sylvestris TaxID=3752 RepID=UPI0021AC49F3|nr:uncharacterized protein LOC126626668 [Malus sylvestris]